MTTAEDVKRIHAEQSRWTALKREVKVAAGAISFFAVYLLTMALMWMWRAKWL